MDYIWWIGVICFLWVFPERALSMLALGLLVVVWIPYGLVPWWFHLECIVLYAFIYPSKWSYFRTFPLWRWIRTYCYGIKYIDPHHIMEEEVSQKGPLTIYAAGPHGVFGEGVHISLSLEEQFVNTTLVGSSVMTWIPIVKDICGLMGMIPANKFHMDYELRVKKNNILLVPEGIRGFLLEDTPEQIPERLGFIECAVKAGARIVPVYNYNVKVLYTRWVPGQWFKHLQHWMLSSRLRYCFILSWGSWLGFFPYMYPVTTIFGAPIKVPETGTPDQKIRSMSAAYTTAMTELRSLCTISK